MKRTLFVALMAVATVCGYRAYAHHALPATYIKGQLVSIEGELVGFMFRNPHSWVQFDGIAKHDKTQKKHRWIAEWASATQLARDNITRDSLKAGDRVVIVGNPGRSPADHRVRMQSIRRLSDGWRWISIVD